MIILIVNLPIRRGTILFLNVSMWEHRVVDRSLDVAHCTSLTSLILLFSIILSFPFDSFKVFFLTNSAMKSPNRILVWYLGTDRISALFAYWRSPVSHLFYPPLWYTRVEHQYQQLVIMVYDILALTNSNLTVVLCTTNLVPINHPHSILHRKRTNWGSCGHGNEPTSSIKRGKFLVWVIDSFSRTT